VNSSTGAGIQHIVEKGNSYPFPAAHGVRTSPAQAPRVVGFGLFVDFQIMRSGKKPVSPERMKNAGGH
jgi:hypothetical protein